MCCWAVRFAAPGLLLDCCFLAVFSVRVTVDGQTTMLLLPPPFQQSSIFVVSKELTQVCFRLLIRGDSNNDLLAHTILILCIASSYEENMYF